MKTLNNLRIKTCLIILLFSGFAFFSFGKNLNSKGNISDFTIASGEWTSNLNWNSNNAPNPGSNDSYTLTFWNNIVYNPGGIWPNPFFWKNNITIIIRAGATLTINSDLEINNNFNITIEEGGQFIVNGNVVIKNNVDGAINGSIYITGDLEIGGGNGDIIGTGEIIVDGDIIGGDGIIDPGLITDIHRWLIVNNGDWNLNTSWSKTAVGFTPAPSAPNYQCIVHIRNGYTAELNVDAEITDLDLQAGGTLNIKAGKTLTVTGDVISSGSILINSDASGTGGLIYNGPNAVTATCERYVTANAYHYVSSPMTSAPVSSYNITSGGYTNPNFYTYNEASSNPDWMYGWLQVTSGNLSPGVGYALYTDENYAYDLSGGTLINQNYSVPVTYSLNGGGGNTWNLVANPFPCNVNADGFITPNYNSGAGVMTQAIYLWADDGTGGIGYDSNDYLVYTLGGGTSTLNGFNFNGTIAPLQAFFVQSTSNGNLAFNTTMKTVAQGEFLKSGAPSPINTLKMLRLSAQSTEGVYNDILIKFAEDAEENEDIYDGLKLKGNNYLAFYSLYKDEHYAIQGFPTNKINELQVKLGIDAKINTDYTIKAEEFVGIDDKILVWLEDSYLNKKIDIKNLDYTFQAYGTITDRFVLHFAENNSNIISEINDIQNNIHVYSNNKTLYINGINTQAKLLIYDISGKLVYGNAVSESSNSIPLNLPNGYYVANIILNDRVKTFKVYLD
jgi:hypothetical protein